MTRLVAAVAVLLALTSGPALAAGPTIYVQNNSTEISDNALADALPALQASIDTDVAPEWHTGAAFTLAHVVPPHSWLIELVDTPACWFCAGYHDIKDGAPHAQVGAGGDWPLNFDHEAKEMLADPFTNRGILISPRKGAKRQWYALEVCDPVEADSLAYSRPSASGKPIHLSDFVLESWFRRGSKGPWDFTHATRRPLQVISEGYQLRWGDGRWEPLSRFS
jgi:hypothetical protein